MPGLSLTRCIISLMISFMSWTRGHVWVACHDVGVVLVSVGGESVDMQGLGLNAVGHHNGCD